ncbi:MAG: SUMF1/EgtB/PvdO family nonheme iron enzyme [Gammaproteobacteria bacterium]|nr:SUMF1/EgtB/PvdO family nonheme iron enzyme [Gammaproteobacteria bacterium]
MKIDAIVIRDAEGERKFSLGDLPLRFGTGSNCDIRLPGPGSAAVVLLDALDGQPFMQPVGRATAVNLNGEPLVASRRLQDGDELAYFGTRIVVASGDETLFLDVQFEDSAYITKPPELPGADALLAEETIAPTAFQRAARTGAIDKKSTAHRWQAAVGAAIAVLAILSYLMFTAKSIRFDVQPVAADSLEINGGWFRISLADRVLLREGSYTVRVKSAGYYDTNQSFRVDATPSRTVRVEMRKLPGFLTVATTPSVEGLVTIDDTIIGEAPFGPIELEPGTHSVTVSADRYLPYADNLVVPGLGRKQIVNVQLVPNWANVDISSAPSGATVLQGRTELGRTPLRLELTEGSHDLTVVHEGFRPWDGVIVTRANVDQVVPLIQLIPANARLTVNSIPRGANVTVNGRYRGQSPIKLDLSPDIDYRIGLSKAGYGSTVRQVRLRAAASESITVDLTARVGKVTISATPKDAEILVDGRVRGTGTMTFNLSSAPHSIEVQKDGYKSFKRSVTPRPGYPQKIQVRLLSNEEARLRSVASTVTNSNGQVLRRVEPGGFTMGASRREQGRRANEVLVPVTLTRPFFIGAKEVTNKEFLRFRRNHISGDGVHASLAANNNPVVSVSWDDAVEYCNWLSTEEGLTPAYKKRFEKWEMVTPTPNGYRLPTEAEWAWAIRFQARSSAPKFPWGNRLPPRRDSGNYAGQSARKLVPSVLPGYDDGYASTAPVGSFPANVLGIYDGGGNVAEWVQDYYSVPQPGQATAVVDPTGPKRGAQHVIRGSSWRHAGITELRSSYRDFGSNGRIDVGFRIARNVN